MKKILIAVATFLFLSVGVKAEISKNDLSPKYVPASTNAMSIYLVGETTAGAHAAYYQVFESSICFLATGGLHPGTTWADFSRTDCDTMGELANFLAAMPVTTSGTWGGVRVSLSSTRYSGDPSTYLNTTGSWVYIMTSTAVVTLTANDSNGMAYLLNKSELNSDQHFCITDALGNLTFNSGTTYFDVFDGSATNCTQIRHEKVPVSGIDAQLGIPQSGYLKGSENTSMLFQLYNSTNSSAGYINITGYQK